MWTCHQVVFIISVDHRVKIKENEKINKDLDFARELKRVEHEVNGDNNCSWCPWSDHQRLEKKPRRVGNQKNVDNSFVEIGQNNDYRSQMTHLLTWQPSWIFLVKASQLCLPHFIGEHLMQQMGCSVVPGWPAQHICMNGVYSPIYSSSKWQWESFSTCVSDHPQVNQYSSPTRVLETWGNLISLKFQWKTTSD